jgi:hypothetical protein
VAVLDVFILSGVEAWYLIVGLVFPPQINIHSFTIEENNNKNKNSGLGIINGNGND